MKNEQILGLQTPCLVLDRTKFIKNIDNMKAHLTSLGVSLRPHVKTAKSLEAARCLFNGNTGPITVSTLREAEYFFEGGFSDILYAVGIVPHKLPRVKSLLKAGARVLLILDSLEMARSVTEYALQNNIVLEILIEIDSDMHRAGLSPDDPLVSEIAVVLNDCPATHFMGFMTHAGESYNCTTPAEIKKHAQIERDAVAFAAKQVEKFGVSSKIISAGSTPTAHFSDDWTGVTEVRAGVFVFQDLFQAGLGVCDVDDIALSVLTTVTGHKKNQNRIIVDAGGLALSKDRGTAAQKFDRLYGLVCSAEDGTLIPDLIVEAANQEHGLITSTSGKINFAEFPIGSRLRILPNHVCMTAAAHSHYYVTDDNQSVTDVWQRCSGW